MSQEPKNNPVILELDDGWSDVHDPPQDLTAAGGHPPQPPDLLSPLSAASAGSKQEEGPRTTNPPNTEGGYSDLFAFVTSMQADRGTSTVRGESSVRPDVTAGRSSRPGDPSQPTTGGRSGRSAGGVSTGKLSGSVAAFWMAGECYAIDTDLVGEVVQVEQVTPVPLAHEAVLGLFNLRGEPVALVDLARLMGLRDADQRPGHWADRGVTALILLRGGRVLAGIRIQRMEAILSPGQMGYVAADLTDLARGIVAFLETGPTGLVVSLLDADATIRRLDQVSVAA